MITFGDERTFVGVWEFSRKVLALHWKKNNNPRVHTLKRVSRIISLDQYPPPQVVQTEARKGLLSPSFPHGGKSV